MGRQGKSDAIELHLPPTQIVALGGSPTLTLGRLFYSFLGKILTVTLERPFTMTLERPSLTMTLEKSLTVIRWGRPLKHRGVHISPSAPTAAVRWGSYSSSTSTNLFLLIYPVGTRIHVQAHVQGFFSYHNGFRSCKKVGNNLGVHQEEDCWRHRTTFLQ